MEITESHIEFAKRQLQKNETIPGVAGSLMNRTPKEAEFSDLIAVANRAKMELDDKQEETDTVTDTDDGSSGEDPVTDPEPTDTASDTDSESAQKEPIAAGAPDTDPVDVDEIASQSNDRGESSWTH